jgi:hypothetical protein
LIVKAAQIDWAVDQLSRVLEEIAANAVAG